MNNSHEQSGNNSDDPFEKLDFMEQIKPEHWVMTSAITTPTLEAALSADLQELTLTFFREGEDGRQQTKRKLERADIEALTRYLTEYAQVAPLPPVDEDVFKDIHPRRVDL